MVGPPSESAKIEIATYDGDTLTMNTSPAPNLPTRLACNAVRIPLTSSAAKTAQET